MSSTRILSSMSGIWYRCTLRWTSLWGFEPLAFIRYSHMTASFPFISIDSSMISFRTFLCSTHSVTLAVFSLQSLVYVPVICLNIITLFSKIAKKNIPAMFISEMIQKYMYIGTSFELSSFAMNNFSAWCQLTANLIIHTTQMFP